MLRSLATRLLFILCMAVVIRVGGGLFSSHPAKPNGPTIAMTDRSGDSHRLPPGLEVDEIERATGKMRASFERDVSRRDISFEPGRPMVDPTPRR